MNAQGFYNNPQTAFYRNQMNNLAGGYGYNQFNQNVPPVTTQQPTNEFPCRPVTSMEEARAAMMIEPVKPHLYTDFQNNRIYVKHIDNLGIAKFTKFIVEPENIEVSPETKQPETFNIDDIKEQVKNEFKEKFDNVNMQIEQLNKELVSLKIAKGDYETKKGAK